MAGMGHVQSMWTLVCLRLHGLERYALHYEPSVKHSFSESTNPTGRRSGSAKSSGECLTKPKHATPRCTTGSNRYFRDDGLQVTGI
jgi:hypothetical protein